MPDTKELGEVLVDEGLITSDQLGGCRRGAGAGRPLAGPRPDRPRSA